MKEQILTLVKHPKFNNNGFKGLFEKEWKHNSKEDLRWLFYLTELQQWLRDTKGIEVSAQVNFYNKNKKLGYFYTLDCFDSNNIHDGKDYDMGQMNLIGDAKAFDSYGLALEQGLFEGLKLVK